MTDDKTEHEQLDWRTCSIGSCHRHEQCMYTPCHSTRRTVSALPDDFDDGDCWNCSGEGYIYGCSWDWQCDTYDAGEGTCLCTHPCHICHPPKHDPALRAVLAEALKGAAQ